MIPVFFCPFWILFFLPRLRTKRPYNIDFRLCLRFKKSSIVVSNPYFNSSLCLKSINQHTRDVVLSCSFVLPDIIIIPFMYFFPNVYFVLKYLGCKRIKYFRCWKMCFKEMTVLYNTTTCQCSL